MKVVQYFSDEYLSQCRQLSPQQIVKYLDDFRLIQSTKPSPTKLISLKVEQDLLAAFKTRARLDGVPYQRRIKHLMRKWLIAEQG